MTRDEAKKLAKSRDCHCIKGKDRDNNYNECIDKIFDYFELEIKNIRMSIGVINSDDMSEEFKKSIDSINLPPL